MGSVAAQLFSGLSRDVRWGSILCSCWSKKIKVLNKSKYILGSSK
jgi:hypothetical protein